MIDDKFIGRRVPSQPVEIDKTMVRRFAEAVGETDPMFFHEDAAAAAGYTSLPCPPTLPFSLKIFSQTLPSGGSALMELFEEMGVKLSSVLHGEQEIAAARVLCAGETVRIESRIESIESKKGGRLSIVRETSVGYIAGCDSPVVEMAGSYIIRHS